MGPRPLCCGVAADLTAGRWRFRQTDIVRRAAVIGGNGFIGSQLVSTLAEGGVQVRSFARRKGATQPGVEQIVGDVTDQVQVRSAVDGVETVYYCAWTTVPQTADENPAWDVESNLVAGLRVLDACVEAGVRTFVFPSSGGTVYGDPGTSDPIDEHHPTEPICSYGVTKLMFERFLGLYRSTRQLDHRILRIGNAYGAGQRVDKPQGLIGVVLHRLLQGEPITVWGDGLTVRDYLHASDVAAALVAAGHAELSEDDPRTFNIGSGIGHSVIDILDEVERVTGWKPVVRREPIRSCDAQAVVLSVAQAKHTLGWSAAVRLEEGIRRTWQSCAAGEELR